MASLAKKPLKKEAEAQKVAEKKEASASSIKTILAALRNEPVPEAQEEIEPAPVSTWKKRKKDDMFNFAL